MAFECLKRPLSKIFWKDEPILNNYYKLQAFYLSRYFCESGTIFQ